MRWATLALRGSLAIAFLSAVADRFGLWGPHGAKGVAWGDWEHFRIYCDQLNWYLPGVLRPAAAAIATFLETVIAMALLTGIRLRETALTSGVLLTSFGIAMAVALSPKAPLGYSVFTAAAASFLLAAVSSGKGVRKWD